MLSRLPHEQPLGEHSINALNIIPQQIRDETINDCLLNKVFNYLRSGSWPHQINSDILLSLHNGIIVWGLRVIIPFKYRERIINDLHDQHPGIIRMKSLSRIHVWYPLYR